MDKIEQIELAKKLETLVEKRIGSHYGFEHRGTPKSVTLKITTSEVKYIRWAEKFLEPYKLPRKRMMKNHGSGMNTTILVDVSKIPEETKTKIENDFNTMLAEIAKKSKNPRQRYIAKAEKEKLIFAESEAVEVPKNKEERFSNPHFAYSRFISSVLKFEGRNFKDLEKIKEGTMVKISSEDFQTIKILEQATNYYFGKKVSFIETENQKTNLIFDCKEKEPNFQVIREFKFTMPPHEGESEEQVLKRLNNVKVSRRYVIRPTNLGFIVMFKSKKTELLILNLLEMGWNAKEDERGFIILTSLEVESSKEIVKTAPIDLKEEAFRKLCKLVESEAFDLLDIPLQKDILDGIKTYADSKESEIMTIYAKELLAQLRS